MKNKPSQRPPPAYQDDSLMTEYTAERSRQTSNSHDLETVTPYRESTIFRFGKSLAATFNPAKWKIWGKNKEDEAERARLEEQAKFHRAYEEIKKKGFIQGTRPAAMAGAYDLQCQSLEPLAATHDTSNEAPVADVNLPEAIPRRIMKHSERQKKTPHRNPMNWPPLRPEDSVSNIGNFPTPEEQAAYEALPERKGILIDGLTTKGHKPIPSHKEIAASLKLAEKVVKLKRQLAEAQKQLAERDESQANASVSGGPTPRHGIQQSGPTLVLPRQSSINKNENLRPQTTSFTQADPTSMDIGELTISLSHHSESQRTPGPEGSRTSNTKRAEPLAGIGYQGGNGTNTTDQDKIPETMDALANISGASPSKVITRKVRRRSGSDAQYKPPLGSDESGSEGPAVGRSVKKRVHSGPNHKVEVVQAGGMVAKMNSVRVQVDGRTGDEEVGKFSNKGKKLLVTKPAQTQVDKRTISAPSPAKSSRIPRPGATSGVHKPEKMGAVNLNDASQAPSAVSFRSSSIPRRSPTKSRSSRSLKMDEDQLGYEVTSQLMNIPPLPSTSQRGRQTSRQPPVNGEKDSNKIRKQTPSGAPREKSVACLHEKSDTESTRTPRKTTRLGPRTKSVTSMHDKSDTESTTSRARTQPSFVGSRKVEEGSSVRGRVRTRGREMSPSKEAFEWGPDVF